MPRTNALGAINAFLRKTARSLRANGKTSLHRIGLSLFVAGALVAAVVVIISTIDAERAQRAQALRTYAILAELRDVGHAAINAETAERGYFITLDTRYLAPYRLARTQYRPALRHIAQRLSDQDATQRQRELLTEIEQLTTAKFAEIDESVAMIGKGELAAAQSRFLSDEGEEVMNRLRRALSEMELIEQQALDQATTRSATAESRVLPLLGLLLVMLLVATALGIRQALHAARAESAEAIAAELAAARDRANLLARELNHRVKNLLAVILAIVRLSARNAPEAREVTESIAHRIQALLIAHDATQGSDTHPVADLEQLIETTLAPHRSAQNACSISGPAVKLPSDKVQSLGLVLHELATNAVKYGAWAQNGSLTIAWGPAPDDDRLLVLEWREFCPEGCQGSDHKGFGSMLIESSARQLGGTITRDFTPNGCHVRFVFPPGA